MLGLGSCLGTDPLGEEGGGGGDGATLQQTCLVWTLAAHCSFTLLSTVLICGSHHLSSQMLFQSNLLNLALLPDRGFPTQPPPPLQGRIAPFLLDGVRVVMWRVSHLKFLAAAVVCSWGSARGCPGSTCTSPVRLATVQCTLFLCRMQPMYQFFKEVKMAGEVGVNHLMIHMWKSTTLTDVRSFILTIVPCTIGCRY